MSLETCKVVMKCYSRGRGPETRTSLWVPIGPILAGFLGEAVLPWRELLEQEWEELGRRLASFYPNVTFMA